MSGGKSMPDVKPKAARKASPSWNDVKAKLTDFDRAGLIGLVQALYVASKDNQAFLHARFTLGRDVLKPYKVTIDRWLWPDAFKNQDTSVAKAKKAISEYKKAIGQPQGLAELMVFYCERASGFSADIGYQDDGYFAALVRMFEQSLQMIATLPDTQRPALWTRLAQVRRTSDSFGYGVGDDMYALLAEYGVDG
ncbi:hypothetical protein LMG23992_04291 [Cupriavidus laharis]|uniref:Uncharacterized protein n=1 Tax=Cupriavidus laharis TaxID=151654 RepID=A0ABM8XKA8_9BURK|nr:hypothetical protein [Cupriavidus laharis]CAG9180633.1 hypothetical protein LMG23992_04291 [Cupriavidus laharis]